MPSMSEEANTKKPSDTPSVPDIECQAMPPQHHHPTTKNANPQNCCYHVKNGTVPTVFSLSSSSQAVMTVAQKTNSPAPSRVNTPSNLPITYHPQNKALHTRFTRRLLRLSRQIECHQKQQHPSKFQKSPSSKVLATAPSSRSWR
ncbi:MAG: hypothetical protein Q9159_000709 [Coniocarpon cinnabarinum]